MKINLGISFPFHLVNTIYILGCRKDQSIELITVTVNSHSLFIC